MKLHSYRFETTLGQVIAIADDSFLYLLEFIDRKNIDIEIAALAAPSYVTITPGKTEPLISIEQELQSYFLGYLKEFKTPIKIGGTPFQKTVWQVLLSIPYGHTKSYTAQAHALGKFGAHRAVANANSRNQLAIIVPCHRVIRSNGDLGGYGAGIERKKWLLEHEKKYL